MQNIIYLFGITLLIQSCAPGIAQYQTAETLGQGNSAHTLSLEHDFGDASFGTLPDDGLDVNLSYRYHRGITEKRDFGVGIGLTLKVL